MEIDGLVANRALVKAREGGGSKGRSWKWQEMLRLPHISQCAKLADSIERDYWDLCVMQPIGRQLFDQFCQSQGRLRKYCELRQALAQFEWQLDNDRPTFGRHIIEKFFCIQKSQFVPEVSKYKRGCMWALDKEPSSDVFRNCKEDLETFLSGEPFQEYQSSMYFERFLQWKFLERRPVTKNDFRQYRLLGKGGFGEVWACQVRATGMMYACKKLEKTHVKRRRGEDMALNEKEILESVDSRFVVNLACAYETKQSLCLVLTMMSGGDLRFHIYNMGAPGLDAPRVQFYAAEVCCGLMHLHCKSIIYRDLKPENILLDEHGHIRISDLGLAIRVSSSGVVRGRVGTLGYMAPELIAREYYGVSVDWWGLGCLIYEMTAGRPVFRHKGEHPKKDDMEERIQTRREEYGERFEPRAKDICSKLLVKDPNGRLGCQASGGRDVQDHPFFQEINFRMLEAGLLEPTFKPDPRLVYCSDVQDIEEFSAVRGVTLNQTDNEFYTKFNTGNVPITWQNELIETGCFAELNVFGPNGSRPQDLQPLAQAPESPKSGLFNKIFCEFYPSEVIEEGQRSPLQNNFITSGILSAPN
ncbi:G protein-coupled receptor kinase 5 isoform X2 [Corythoichthys intestinalis]|uniref:G protein-coupled receptor kinase 5 isoform X2 n=1 Tax=Corythoichthys intestinalis TaxID=161448 RepID=UPI0025A5BA45|nr:G protein-coupled receptor kinase 5 isoform X2 [Corythoichthys intestinalis]XP_061800370.1 G protein-coupled receptor kinase 6-like [Nerophis lumbriciformis]